jgi:hypothetical protein
MKMGYEISEKEKEMLQQEHPQEEPKIGRWEQEWIKAKRERDQEQIIAQAAYINQQRRQEHERRVWEAMLRIIPALGLWETWPDLVDTAEKIVAEFEKRIATKEGHGKED